jgi:hypothetical protein
MRIEAGGAFCELCQFLWAAFIIAGCSYLVFWKGASAWWYVLAVILLPTKCRKPESE